MKLRFSNSERFIFSIESELDFIFFRVLLFRSCIKNIILKIYTIFSRKDNSLAPNYRKCTKFIFIIENMAHSITGFSFLNRKIRFKTMKLKRIKVHVSNNC